MAADPARRLGPQYRYRRAEPRRLEPTDAELWVLRYMSVGCTREQAAEQLGRSLETVKSQLMSARLKLAAKNTTHAVALAHRLGLID